MDHGYVGIGVDATAMGVEAATMCLFVQRLERYERDVVDLVIWFLGFRIGDVVASWRRNIGDLLELVTQTGTGWNPGLMARLGAVGQGQVLLGRLNELPKAKRERLLGFVWDMTLPCGRLRLAPASAADSKHFAATKVRSDNCVSVHSVFTQTAAYDLDSILAGKAACRMVKNRTCPECAFQGFGCAVELDRALPPGGAYCVLWALACGKNPGKSGGYKEKMAEATEMLDRIRWPRAVFEKVVDDPRKRPAGVLPGPEWLRTYYRRGARTFGKPVKVWACHKCWAYTKLRWRVPAAEETAGDGGTWEYGVWGEDDCGTIYPAKPLLRGEGNKGVPLMGVRLRCFLQT